MVSRASFARMPSLPIPVSILKCTFAVLRSFFAAADIAFASSTPVTGSVTDAFTISAISSGMMLERICTSPLDGGTTFLNSSAS